ncbi:hypothetical protein [Flavobacterium sp.]|jgi:hypothetical protein|uniref:hypothetical protein n=1 Tax=Flavobacterium sp. TaxID=239 RepID=UPI0037BFFEAD
MTLLPILKQGQLLRVENGSYTVNGFFVALKEFDPKKELEEYLADKPDQRYPNCFRCYDYLSKLLEKGFLLELEHATLFLGAYGDVKEFSFNPI